MITNKKLDTVFDNLYWADAAWADAASAATAARSGSLEGCSAWQSKSGLPFNDGPLETRDRVERESRAYQWGGA